MATLDNIISGTFTSAGVPVDLNIRCDLDYIFTENLTQAATTQATGRAVKCEHHRGMATDSQIRWFKDNAGNGLNMTVDTSGGFTLINSTNATPGAAVALTGISQASPAVVSTGSTAGLSQGDIVRVYGTTAMLQVSSLDFTVGTIVANTSFQLAYLNSSGFAAAATAGFWRKIPFDAQYYPRRRYITAITAANPAVVTMSVTHGLTVGQLVRVVVPTAFGMTQINGQIGRITAINTTTNTITLGNIDSSSYTAFAFPTSATAGAGVTFAQIVPIGDAPATIANTNADQSVLDGATDNLAFLGVRLAAGAQAPAGSSGDVIRWVALKSTQYQS